MFVESCTLSRITALEPRPNAIVASIWPSARDPTIGGAVAIDNIGSESKLHRVIRKVEGDGRHKEDGGRPSIHSEPMELAVCVVHRHGAETEFVDDRIQGGEANDGGRSEVASSAGARPVGMSARFGCVTLVLIESPARSALAMTMGRMNCCM